MDAESIKRALDFGTIITSGLILLGAGLIYFSEPAKRKISRSQGKK